MAETNIQDESPEVQIDRRRRTYYGFLHLMRTVVLHILLMATGLYFLAINPVPGFGFFMILVAVAALGYGIARTPAARERALRRIQHEHQAA